MKTYVVESSSKSITLGFKDVNLSIISPMIVELNRDVNVSAVRFIDQHPELSDRMLYIEVKKGKPETAVNKASKALSKYYSSIKE